RSSAMTFPAAWRRWESFSCANSFFWSVARGYSPPTPFGLRRGSLRYDRACPVVARGASEGWWGRKDSNLRSHEAGDLQSAPFATRDTSPSANVRYRPPEWRRAGPWMTLRPKARIEPAAAGAFMGEGGWQSQPMETTKNAAHGPNCHIRAPVTQAPHE